MEWGKKDGLVVCKKNVDVYALCLNFPFKYLSFVNNVFYHYY